MEEGFGPVALPVPPSSGGACVEGVPPEIGLEALALPTSRQLMAVGHNYYQKAPTGKRNICIFSTLCNGKAIPCSALALQTINK